MKNFCLGILLIFTSYVALAQNPQSANFSEDGVINFELSNYSSDSLVIGYYYGQRTLVLDTLSDPLMDEGTKVFSLTHTDTLAHGVYLILTQPDNQFIQFFINEGNTSFSIKANGANLGEVKIVGSEDNLIFLNHIDFLNQKRAIADPLRLRRDSLPDGEEKEELSNKLVEIDKLIKAEQALIMESNPKYLTSILLKSNKFKEMPEFVGSEKEVKNKEYIFYKNHYFDNVDLGDCKTFRTPFYHQRVDFYLNKLTPQIPDSINHSIDYLLSEMESCDDAYQFYLSYFLNTYANSKFVGYDAIYVHLVLHYYDKGKAPWVESEKLDEMVTNAKRLRPTLIGQVAKDFTVYTQEKESIRLYELDKEYTVLFFWAPDCGHCTKAAPHMVEFQQYADSLDIAVLSICTKMTSKYESCWSGAKEKGLEKLLNVGDQYNRSKIFSKYFIRTTPTIFILDRNKEIVVKGIAAERLKDILEEIRKSKELEKKPASKME